MAIGHDGYLSRRRSSIQACGDVIVASVPRPDPVSSADTGRAPEDDLARVRVGLDLEVALLQAADRVALLVRDHDVDVDDADVHRLDEPLRLALGLFMLGGCCDGEEKSGGGNRGREANGHHQDPRPPGIGRPRVVVRIVREYEPPVGNRLRE